MKKSIFKKIICSLLAVAVVVTAAPEVGAITGITAEAKTKAAKITWKGAAFNKKEGIYVGKTSLQGVDGFLVFANLKASGSYWVTTNSKNLTVKMDVNSVKKQFKDKSFWVNYGDCIPFHINAKKPGTYKITVKEKYKGKTRTIKTLKMYVYEPKTVETYTTYVNSEFDVTELLSNYHLGTFSYNYGEDNDYFSIEGDGKYLNPLKEGETKVTIYDNLGKECGTVNVTIKTNHCTGIKLSEDDEDSDTPSGINLTWDPDYNDNVTLTNYFEVEGEANDEYIAVSDELKITSADPSVFKVWYEDDEDAEQGWRGQAQKVGDTTITVTCGGYSLEIPVHITKESDD